MFAHNLESNRRQTDDDAPHAPREGRLRFRRAFLTACAGLLCSGPVQAALHDRGGGLVYDDVLDVTWLQDANYARTSGYDGDGKMSWVQAQLWAENLNYYDSVRGVTYSDWRLPQTFDLGAPGCDYGYSGTDCGYNLSIASSELAHLYYADFGNRAFTDSRGLQQPGYGLVDDPANPPAMKACSATSSRTATGQAHRITAAAVRRKTMPGISTPTWAARTTPAKARSTTHGRYATAMWRRCRSPMPTGSFWRVSGWWASP